MDSEDDAEAYTDIQSTASPKEGVLPTQEEVATNQSIRAPRDSVGANDKPNRIEGVKDLSGFYRPISETWKVQPRRNTAFESSVYAWASTREGGAPLSECAPIGQE